MTMSGCKDATQCVSTSMTVIVILKKWILEVMCRHQEKYGTFQQRGKGK
jgi:hypothetical protein